MVRCPRGLPQLPVRMCTCSRMRAASDAALRGPGHEVSPGLGDAQLAPPLPGRSGFQHPAHQAASEGLPGPLPGRAGSCGQGRRGLRCRVVLLLELVRALTPPLSRSAFAPRSLAGAAGPIVVKPAGALHHALCFFACAASCDWSRSRSPCVVLAAALWSAVKVQLEQHGWRPSRSRRRGRRVTSRVGQGAVRFSAHWTG